MNVIEYRRWQVVDYVTRSGKASYQSAARKFKCSPAFVHKWVQHYKRHHHVTSLPRKVSGAALRAAKTRRACALVQQDDFNSAARVGNQLEVEFGTKASAATVRRWLEAAGMRFQPPKYEQVLTPQHKAKRVAFSQRTLDLNVNSLLITDSKVFFCHPPRYGRYMKRWAFPGQRRVVATVKHSQKVHAYAGISRYGVTELVFVSGTTGRVSPYINPKTRKPHSGVCGAEYEEVIAPKLISDGQKVFDGTPFQNDWVYQQDGAPPHRTKGSQETVQELVPGGLLADWPPNSPDLSPIENVWSWMEQELRRRPICRTAAELEVVLTTIWEDMRENHSKMLENLFASLPDRLHKVVALHGAHIGR
jgi:transposase